MPASEPLIAALYGGPGAGKSTTAAALFASLKFRGVNCELVHEVAKDFTWEDRTFALQHQAYLMAKQIRNYDRLYGKVDLIITDTSPRLASVYANGLMRARAPFLRWIDADWNERKTLDIFLRRDPTREYNPHGRRQTKLDAEALDVAILKAVPEAWIVTVENETGAHVHKIEKEILECLPH